MSRHAPMRQTVLLAGLVLVLAPPRAALQAQDQVPFEAAQIFFEFNSSAQDLGIQVFLDGEAWKELLIVKPDGQVLTDVKGKGSLKQLGLTEFFFESDEPSFTDLPSDSLLKLFPEGTYHFFGVTVEGRAMASAARLTHNIPDGPVILSPEEGGLVDRDNAVIRWAPVTTPAGIHISRYQVVIEHAGRTWSVDVPAGTTHATVTKEYLLAGTDYKFEVLAKERGGNQTITEGTLRTR